MSNLLAKRYKNNKVQVQTKAKTGKNLASNQKVKENNKSIKTAKTENVTVMKESKTLMLD